MTNQQGAPEALRHADGLEAFAKMLPAYGFNPQPLKDAAATVRSLHALALELADQLSGKNQRLAALVEAQQPAAHVQKPAEIEHVSGDVSRNRAESNMVQQPATSAAAAGQQAGWRWVPTEPTEAMFTRFSQQIEEGVVYLGGFLNAYRCMLDAAPQPSPTPQADSQPAVDALAEAEYFIDNPSAWSNFDQRASDAIAAVCKALRAARAPADSVTAPEGGGAGPSEILALVTRYGAEFADYLHERRGNWTTKRAVEARNRYRSTFEQIESMIEATPTPPAQAADSVLEDAALLRYALADGGNQSMNWQDIYDDWNGGGYFIDALRAAYRQDAARKQGGV